MTKKATLTLPMGGSNITPIPKVEVPLEDTDFRGINVTHVIARAFKRVIYDIFCNKDQEMYIAENQHSYRTGAR